MKRAFVINCVDVVKSTLTVWKTKFGPVWARRWHFGIFIIYFWAYAYSFRWDYSTKWANVLSDSIYSHTNNKWSKYNIQINNFSDTRALRFRHQPAFMKYTFNGYIFNSSQSVRGFWACTQNTSECVYVMNERARVYLLHWQLELITSKHMRLLYSYGIIFHIHFYLFHFKSINVKVCWIFFYIYIHTYYTWILTRFELKSLISEFVFVLNSFYFCYFYSLFSLYIYVLCVVHRRN